MSTAAYCIVVFVTATWAVIGFLAGKYRSESDVAKSARRDMVKKYMNERGLGILGALDRVAQQHGVTLATVALAWLINRPGITAPIASATNLDQLSELIEATEFKLNPASIDLLNQASA